MKKIIFYPTIGSHFDSFEIVGHYLQDKLALNNAEIFVLYIPGIAGHYFTAVTSFVKKIDFVCWRQIKKQLKNEIFCCDGGLLIVGNDAGQYTKRVINLAKKYNYKTILFQDGWLESGNINKPIGKEHMSSLKYYLKYFLGYRWFPFKYFFNGFIGQNADFNFVYSEFAKEEFIKAGINKSLIYVVGSPRHYKFKVDQNKINRQTSDVLDFVYFSTPSFNEDDQIQILISFSWISELLKTTYENYRLWIKCHPRESTTIYELYQSENVFLYEKSTLELVNELTVSMAFCFNSTVMLELMIRDIPFIQLVPDSRKTSSLNYLRELPMVKNQKELHIIFSTMPLSKNFQMKYYLADIDPHHNSVEISSNFLLTLLYDI